MTTQLDMQAPYLAPTVPVLMHRIEPERNMHRYDRQEIVEGFFGDYGLVLQWGRIGTRGQNLTEWHDAPEVALSAMRWTVGRKRRRGYALSTPHRRPSDASGTSQTTREVFHR